MFYLNTLYFLNLKIIFSLAHVLVRRNSALMLLALNPSREIFVAFILTQIQVVDCYSLISSSISSSIIFTVNTIIFWKKEGDQRLL
jgi:hypothetical protein